MATSREVAKTLIEISATEEEANNAVEDYLGDSSTYEKKLSFLRDMFPTCAVMVHKGDSDESIYNLMLHAIIQSKYY